MAQISQVPSVASPEGFVVEVSSELSPESLHRRAHAINAILRLAMLAGLRMELDATISTFADVMADVVPYERLVYFWDEERGEVRLRLARGLQDIDPQVYSQGNTFNLWVSQFGRPLLVSGSSNEAANAILGSLRSKSAVVIPITIRDRTLGSVQLFTDRQGGFSEEDAQLLWIFSLVAENQLNRELANEGLLQYAFTDYLTGLRSRGYFEQQLDLEIKRAERKRTSLSLLMIDIDYFKQLNDQRGHHVGDQALRELAKLLQNEMRDLDTAARYGGEEFVVILPETDGEGAWLVAQRLRKIVQAANFSWGQQTARDRITVSVGIAVFGHHARFKRELIQCADSALYRAKAGGRNQVVMYSQAERGER